MHRSACTSYLHSNRSLPLSRARARASAHALSFSLSLNLCLSHTFPPPQKKDTLGNLLQEQGNTVQFLRLGGVDAVMSVINTNMQHTRVMEAACFLLGNVCLSFFLFFFLFPPFAMWCSARASWKRRASSWAICVLSFFYLFYFYFLKISMYIPHPDG